MEYKLSGNWEEFCEAVVDAISLRETTVEYVIEDDEVHNKNDKGYKYLLSIKKNFIDFVKTFMKISWNEETTGYLYPCYIASRVALFGISL